MGFSSKGCRRALLAVGGSDTNAAMNWVVEHSMVPDFNNPLPEPTVSSEGVNRNSCVDEGVVMSLVENLGCFTTDQVRAALIENSGAADRASDWLFSHMDNLDAAISAINNKDVAPPPSATAPLDDGEGKYTMTGMISHIGKHTGSGHYVAHLPSGTDKEEE